MTIVETPPGVAAPPVNDAIVLVQPPIVATVASEPTASSEPPRSPRHKRERHHAVLAGVVLAVLAVVACALAAVLATTASTAGPTGPAAAPADLQVTGVAPHAVSLRWNAPLTDAEVLGYDVVRDGVVADVLMPVESTYIASGLAAGRTFTFQVRAIYAHALSAPSSAVAVTTR